LFFGTSVGLLITGAVWPRQIHPDDVRQLKRTLTAIVASSLIVMLLTMSLLSALVLGAVIGLVLSGFFQLFSSIDAAGQYARSQKRVSKSGGDESGALQDLR
jgi:hypothetical protein